MLGPIREAVLVEREASLQVLDCDLILEEQDGAVAVCETLDLALSLGELLLRYDWFEDLKGDVPKLLVLSAEEEDSL